MKIGTLGALWAALAATPSAGRSRCVGTPLGVSAADAQVWYLSSAGLQAVGPQDEWFARAACR